MRSRVVAVVVVVFEQVVGREVSMLRVRDSWSGRVLRISAAGALLPRMSARTECGT